MRTCCFAIHTLSSKLNRRHFYNSMSVAYFIFISLNNSVQQYYIITRLNSEIHYIWEFIMICLERFKLQLSKWKHTESSRVKELNEAILNHQATWRILTWTNYCLVEIGQTSYCGWRRSVVVSALASINVVNRRWARLLLGWVTACGR